MTVLEDRFDLDDPEDDPEFWEPAPARPLPRVLEAPTEEECYLAAILMDASGVDLAEFCWVDERAPDGCFRLWPFQWAWWRCQDAKQVDQNGRKTGKSESIKARVCIFSFIHPSGEMCITAPEKVHVTGITERIETQLTQTRLLHEIIRHGREGINRWPFRVRFLNGTRVFSRIPQITGKAVKGVHAIWLDVDEGQDYPPQGWEEIRETLESGVPGAVMRVHGVTRGVDDDFKKATEPGSGYTVHRFTQLHKPTWNKAEHQKALDNYKSEDDPEYRRQILGLHGDSTNAIFHTGRYWQNVDTIESSAYNLETYHHQKIRFEEVADQARISGRDASQYGEVLVEMIDFRQSHLAGYKVFWVGMDVGIAKDPSAIMVFGEHVPSARERAADQKLGLAVPIPEGQSQLRLLMRLELLRMTVPDQVRAVMAIIDFYHPRAIALDATGNGLGIFQSLQDAAMRTSYRVDMVPGDDTSLEEEIERLRHQASAVSALTAIKGYNFGSKIIVGLHEGKAEEFRAANPNHSKADLIEAAAIRQQVKERATDVCRLLVDTGRLRLPYDASLISQMNGQTWTWSQSLTDAYGNRAKKFSAGEFHAFDGVRMAVLAHSLQALEAFLKEPEVQESLIPRFHGR